MSNTCSRSPNIGAANTQPNVTVKDCGTMMEESPAILSKAWLAGVAALCVASVSSQPPQQNTSPIPIISYVNDGVNADGSYQWSYETGNGIKAQEQGELKNAGSENEGISAQGSFSFTADDGQTYSVTYIADENGFQPQGAHLPTPPPIPEAILRSLEFNEKNPEPEEAQQGAVRRPGRSGPTSPFAG